MDWKANWIWSPVEKAQAFSHIHTRKSFQIDQLENLNEAVFHISCNNIYRLFLNGTFIGRGPDRADPRFPYYDSYNISKHLITGKNVLAIESYCITSEEDRGRSWCIYNGAPGLIFQANLDFKGQTLEITSDESCKVLPSPIWKHHERRINRFQGFIEYIDGSMINQLENYRSINFDDQNWDPATVLGSTTEKPNELGLPLKKEIPFLTETQHRPVGVFHQQEEFQTKFPRSLMQMHSHPCTVTAIATPTQIEFDFGRSMGGMLNLFLEDCNGGSLEIYYGENRNTQLCEIIDLPTSGKIDFESLDWRAGRYVQLKFINVQKPTTISKISFKELEYPFDEPGDFDCNDPLYGAIWRMCKLTAKVATKDHPQDCVGREQALWVCDLDVHSRSLMSCFGNTEASVKALLQCFRIMNDQGVIATPGPVALGYHYDDEELPWSEVPLSIPLIIRDLYHYSGNRNTLETFAPKLKTLISFFENYEDKYGLLNANKDGLQSIVLFISYNLALKSHISTIFNIKYYTSLKACFEIYTALDHPEAHYFKEKMDKIRTALFEHFYDKELGVFKDGEKDGQKVNHISTSLNAWALLSQLIPQEHISRCFHTIQENGEILRSPFDASIMLEVYFKYDQYPQAKQLIKKCWGQLHKDGKETLPEFWNADRYGDSAYGVDPMSECHPFGSGPCYLFHQYILGVKALQPGFSEIEVRPAFLDLSMTRGRVPTPKGDIDIYWRKNQSEVFVEITIPEHIKAKVTLPCFELGSGQLFLDKKLVWEDSGWERNLRAHYASVGEQQQEKFPKEQSVDILTPGRHSIEMRTWR